MTKSNIMARDPSSGSRLQVIPEQNVRWSSGTKWGGLIAEQYRFRSIETPEFAVSDHNLTLNLSTPALIELEIDGCRDSHTRQPGDLSLFPADALRQIRSNQAHEVLVISVSRQIFVRAFETRGGRPPELVKNPRFRDVQMEHIGNALKAEAKNDYLSGPLYGEGLGLALATHLIANYSVDQHEFRMHKGGMAPRGLRRVLDYIHDNLDDQLRLSTLADIAGLSQYRFAHNFQRATGVSPHQYVIHTRIERGKQMLRETDLSVLEIAYALGFQSSSRFTTLFRREAGITPSRYRASVG